MVSVVIPTYKRSTRLATAINSLLNQTYAFVEIIVVDDNDDETYRKDSYNVLKPYIEEHKIVYISQNKNMGGCKTRNTGAFIAKGEFLTFLDDDDFYEPKKIELQVDYLNKNKHLDACMCSMFRIDENKKQIISRENKARGTNLKEAVLDGNLFTSMLLIKQSVFNNLNGFTEIPRFQDKYFHYKFLEQNNKIGVLDVQLLTLVEHNDFRISLTASEKIVSALTTLRAFEIKHKTIFNKKELKFLNHRFYFNKAYVLCRGSFNQKMHALINIFKSTIYYTGDFNVKKITLKAITPNFILNAKN